MTPESIGQNAFTYGGNKVDKKQKEQNTEQKACEQETAQAAEEAAEVDAESATPAEDGAEKKSAEDGAAKALAEAQALAEDYKRKWYSVTAEYDNYRKRTALTRSQAYAEGRADVVSRLFPIADNLERALASCKEEGTKKGIGMVIASFSKLLEDEKIVVIDPVGEEFDAEKCEAILAVEPEEGEESGIVKQVFLKGYEQNGKVLRFAQVSVTK